MLRLTSTVLPDDRGNHLESVLPLVAALAEQLEVAELVAAAVAEGNTVVDLEARLKTRLRELIR